MIDISTESLLSLADAARALPGRPHASTLWRWRTRGVAGRKLETVSLGGRVYTSREALQRFASHSGDSPAPARSDREREAAIARAEEELR